MLQDNNTSQETKETAAIAGSQSIPNAAEISDDDEISLIDLVAVLWRWKWMIIGVTAAFMIGVVIYCFRAIKMDPEKSYMPNLYEVSSTMIIKDAASSGGVSMSSGASSLASLMGVKVQQGPSTSSLIIYLLQTNLFYDAVVEKFDLIKKNKIENAPVSTSRAMVKGLIKAEYAGGTGVLTIKCENKDKQYAYDLVSFAVEWVAQKLAELGIDNNQITKQNLEKNLDTTWKKIQDLTYELQNLTTGIVSGNQIWSQRTTLEQNRIEIEMNAQKDVYTQLKSQLEVLKINMQTEAPTFQILEAPIIPDKKSGPDRAKLCMIVSAAGLFISIFLAFLLNAILNISKDPEVKAKLKGKK